MKHNLTLSNPETNRTHNLNNIETNRKSNLDQP